MSTATGEPAASQREVNFLREDLRALSRRVDGLDTHGPRSMLILAANITELTQDVTEVRSEVAEHRATHAEEAQDRTRSRRWAITAGLAAAGTAVTMLTMMVQILAHLR